MGRPIFDHTIHLSEKRDRIRTRLNGGATTGPRSRYNFIEGTGIDITVTDDPANDETDVTIASTSSGGEEQVGGFDPRPRPHSAHWFGPTFAVGSDSGSVGFSSSYINSGVDVITTISPLWVGEERDWDGIGGHFRFSSSPGTPAAFRFVVYELDPTTLLPTSLLFYSGADQSQANTGTGVFTTESITLTTTSVWLGVGWQWGSDGSVAEGYAVKAFNSGTIADAGRTYTPYGITTVGDTMTAHMRLVALQDATGSAPGAPAAGTFGFATLAGENATFDTGIYLRMA